MNIIEISQQLTEHITNKTDWRVINSFIDKLELAIAKSSLDDIQTTVDTMPVDTWYYIHSTIKKKLLERLLSEGRRTWMNLLRYIYVLQMSLHFDFDESFLQELVQEFKEKAPPDILAKLQV